ELNNRTLEEDQEDDDDEDACDQETDQTSDLTDYQFVRDREPRTKTKPSRFRDESNIAVYAFVAAKEEDTHEPLTYQEAVACKESSKWKFAMKEEMDSLRKNKTWELVDHPAGQKLVRHTSIRVILTLTTCKDYELEQLDVKTTFLHGNLEEVIYMRFKHSSYDSCVYYRIYAPGEYIYLLLYVDDMLIACKSKADIGSTKSLLKKEFDMDKLGEAKKILGMEIVRDQSRKILRVSQFGDCDVERMSKVPYENAVGSLMYLMVCTRPDITYAVRYCKRGFGVWDKPWKLCGRNRFVDSNYAKEPDKGRSITGYAFLVHGCVVSWRATLQHVVALSTIEAEYMALTEAVKEAIWLRGLLEDEVLEEKTVKVQKMGTKHNAVDALTNVVPGLKLQYYLELLNVGIG
ncbi:retrotransposon protein, putative, ty1-copia subclass, partial [Tanacetum coccineum]